MKSLICIAVLFLCITISSYSQEHKGFIISVSAGPSFPLGKFGSKSLTDSTAGWAQAGITGNLSVAYQVSAFVGVTVVAGIQANKEDEDVFIQSLGKTNSSVTTISASTKSWQMWKLMAGPALRLPLSHSGNIVFTASITAGLCKTTAPGYSYTATLLPAQPGNPPGAVAASLSQSSLPAAFCFSVHPGLSFRLVKGLYLAGAVSYFQTTVLSSDNLHPNGIVFNGTTTSPAEPGIRMKEKKWLNSIAAEAGIEVRL